MMKFALSIIMSVLSAVAFLPVTAAAQIQPLSDTGVSEQPFHRTRAQKGVKVSTDVFAIALPASALVGTLVMKDWQGLLQGVETAAVTAAATYILKYTVKERRPDGSDLHSFPSGHT